MKSRHLDAALGHAFGRPELLRQALTHRSFGATHNERLEFLGDAVLNSSISATLYSRFPTLKEGELSRLRASLVRQDTLAGIAAGLALGERLSLGEGELKTGGATRPSILADALEAVIGAVFVDAGYAAADALVNRLFAGAIAALDPKHSGKDAKTQLQELLQGRRLELPRYTLLATRGEAHAQEFEVECAVPELGIAATGCGSSRRLAEQAAARTLLEEFPK